METAWSQVAECQKIVDKLISATVRIMPASAAGHRAPEPAFALARRRLRFMTMSPVIETRIPCKTPNTRKFTANPCHKPMMIMFSMKHRTSPV